MGGKGHQAGVLNGGFHLFGGQAVQAGQLHAVIPHLLDLFHSAGKIAFRVLTDRVHLHGNGQGFHGKLLLSS